MSKLPNDATASSRGTRFQFVIALEKCFEMTSGQSVYIETLGDVSTLGGDDSAQIETKQYSNKLTDMHMNIWKTLKNWMSDKFDASKFNNLIFITTQEVSKDSIWNKWNSLSEKERLKELTILKDNYSKRTEKSSELQKYIEYIFDDSRTAKINEVLKKVYI